MKVLYVILNNGELQYAEFDEKDIPEEEMINMLKESGEVKEIYESISNVGPMGLLWKKEEEVKVEDDDDAISDVEYEHLVKYAKHKEILDFYDLCFECSELFQDVYEKSGLPMDNTWCIAPSVLKNDTQMDALYNLLRRAVIDDLSSDYPKIPKEYRDEVKEMFAVRTTYDAIDTSVIDSLIQDEKDAIAAYEEAIKNAPTEEAAKLYEHIKVEEEEHLKELLELKDKLIRG